MPLLIAAAVALAMGDIVAQTSSSGKPVKTAVVSTYFKAPPNSLSEMVTTADAVIRVRATGTSTPFPRGKWDRVMSAYRFRVLEIMHSFGGYNVDPEQITVLKDGGDLDRGAYIERVVHEGFPPFEPGREYVLFLKWNSPLEGWVPAFGPDSVWDVSKGHVESPGSASVTKTHKGQPTAAALEQIRLYQR
jgi:hypothetical protein